MALGVPGVVTVENEIVVDPEALADADTDSDADPSGPETEDTKPVEPKETPAADPNPGEPSFNG